MNHFLDTSHGAPDFHDPPTIEGRALGLYWFTVHAARRRDLYSRARNCGSVKREAVSEMSY